MLILLLILFILTIINKDSVIASSLDSLKLWTTVLFPSMFFPFVLSDLIKNNLNNKVIKKILKILQKVFNLKFLESGAIILLSLFCGNPGSAKLINEYLEDKKIDLEEANILITFTSFMSPFYLITISSILLQNSYLISLILSHYLSMILYGFIITRKYNKERIRINNFDQIKTPIFKVFSNSIDKNIVVLFKILGVIVTFNAIISLIMPYFGETSIYFNLLLEILTGLNKLTTLPIDAIKKGLIAAFVLGFNGFSIHLQIKQIYPNLEYKKFIISKLLIGILSCLIFYILTFVDSITINSFNNQYILLVLLIIFFVIYFFILIFSKKGKKENHR